MDAPGTSGSDSKEIHTGWMIVVMVGAWPHSGASQALRAYFRYRAASGDALLGRPATGHGRCGGRDRPRRLTTCHEVFPLCRETARSVAFCSARSLASLRRYDCPRRRRSRIATRGTPTLTRPVCRYPSWPKYRAAETRTPPPVSTVCSIQLNEGDGRQTRVFRIYSINYVNL